MSAIIEKLKENQFQTVDKSSKACPICGGDLYTAHNWMMPVFDGNTVYHCEHNEEHKFWNHPFEDSNILHLNKYASETDFDSEKDFELINGF